MIGDAIKKETTVAINTPKIVNGIWLFGDIDKYAMIDPGEDGPISPHFVNVKNVIAQMLPTIGAMITIGFIRIYGK